MSRKMSLEFSKCLEDVRNAQCEEDYQLCMRKLELELNKLNNTCEWKKSADVRAVNKVISLVRLSLRSWIEDVLPGLLFGK